MSKYMDDRVEQYLTDLAGAEHGDAVLTEMEEYAGEHGFPIVGRATGRFLEVAARSVQARRVMELGSGYGYSAYWFARAVGESGEVVCTDGDPANAERAERYLTRAGVWSGCLMVFLSALGFFVTLASALAVLALSAARRALACRRPGAST